MNNLKNYISERGGIYKQEELDEVLADQRQMCAEKASGIAVTHEGQFDLGLAVYDACIEATGENDE